MGYPRRILAATRVRASERYLALCIFAGWCLAPLSVDSLDSEVRTSKKRNQTRFPRVVIQRDNFFSRDQSRRRSTVLEKCGCRAGSWRGAIGALHVKPLTPLLAGVESATRVTTKQRRPASGCWWFSRGRTFLFQHAPR